MHKVILFLCLSLAAFPPSMAQGLDRVGVSSSMTLREADSAGRSDGRPVFVYLYLRSCPACRSFEAGTLGDASIRRTLAERFHFTALDASSRAAVEWRGRLYGWDRSKGMNGAAALLAKGGVSFPVSVILSSSGDFHQAVPGDIGAEEMDCLLAYVYEGRFGSQSYDEFRSGRLKHLERVRQ